MEFFKCNKIWQKKFFLKKGKNLIKYFLNTLKRSFKALSKIFEKAIKFVKKML